MENERYVPPPEDCVEWGDTDGTVGGNEKSLSPNVTSQSAGENRKTLCMAITTFCISIPALVGQWCWPILLASIFSASISGSSAEELTSFAHTITFGITLAIMTNFIQYFYVKSSKRSGLHFIKYGPLYLSILATCLVMMDLTRHVLQDNELVHMSMYNEDGSLTSVGIFMTVIGTWLGYTCLFIAVFWEIKFVSKLKNLYLQFKRDRQMANASGTTNSSTANNLELIDPLLSDT